MCLPPLTVKTCPVIVSALSEVKNTIAFPTSSGSASHFKGLFSSALLLNPSYSNLLRPEYQNKLVSVIAGATAFTLIPKGAYSSADAFVSISSPAFVMLYEMVP